jgi:hypothetical protein
MDEATRAETMEYLAVSDEDDDDIETASSSSQRFYGSHVSRSNSFEFSNEAPTRNASSTVSDSKRRIQQQRRKQDRSAVQESRARHRKRRYDILSKLLLSTAELLELGRGQVKAFLPMLAKLLVPKNKRPRVFAQKRPPLWRGSAANQQSSSFERDVRHKTTTTTTNKEALKYTAPVHSFVSGPGSEDFYSHQLDRIEHLRPFLESMTPGAGFRCMSMFLMQHLLTSQEGYDARVRHAVKAVGVLVLVHDMEHDPVDVLSESMLDGGDEDTQDTSTRRHGRPTSRLDMVEVATRKFESLELAVATKLLEVFQHQDLSRGRWKGGDRRGKARKDAMRGESNGPTREQVMRGLKIGGAAVAAGTLFAITGGLAAPGIAAGLAGLAGGTAASAAVAGVLTSTAAMTAIFGVGGGSLAAYKMQRRTQGLTEFEFNKENHRTAHGKEKEGNLFSTICISGWVRDIYDFQRPWGVTPTKPRLMDRLELLERFYAIHSPDHIPKCRKILQSWIGEERQLWKILEQKYGCDPDHLFPLENGPRLRGSLTVEQEEVIDRLFVDLGYKTAPSVTSEVPTTSFDKMRSSWMRRGKNQPYLYSAQSSTLRDSIHGPMREMPQDVPSFDFVVNKSVSTMNLARTETKDSPGEVPPPKHISTVWSYTETYGGEIYTIRWESQLLIELCDSVSDLAFDLVSGGTAQVLKHTALATLMSAIAWPYALVSAANMIDGTWTLAVERADEAGKELARSLLFSRAGHRPVTLVGYSFGARTVYSCLKELARYQEKWEDFQECGKMPTSVEPELGLEGQSRKDFYKQIREPASIVEDAILLGLPNQYVRRLCASILQIVEYSNFFCSVVIDDSLSTSSWQQVRQVVAGRLVNCFSQKDLILSLMFQFKRLGLKPVCGTCPVNVDGVENIDVSDLISGHQDYCLFAGDILKRVRHGQPFQSRPVKLFVPDVETGAADNSSDTF